jgi:hypothetical protein
LACPLWANSGHSACHSIRECRRQVAKGTDPVRDPAHHDSNWG